MFYVELLQGASDKVVNDLHEKIYTISEHMDTQLCNSKL